MRYFFFALLALVALGNPARADMRALTLKGHQYHFDIPADFVETTESATDHSKFFESPNTITGISFSVVSRNFQQQMTLSMPGIQRDTLFDGRVGRMMPAGSDNRSLFAGVFTASCSGECILLIGIGGAVPNSLNKPFDFLQAKSLLEYFANQLGRGGFGGY